MSNNWSPFLSGEMDAWFSGSWPDQQPNTHLALQSNHPSTPSLAPFLPPLFNSLTSLHSPLGSPRPNLGFHAVWGHPATATATAPSSASASASASALGSGLSPFAAPAFPTSSQLARRRRDGPTLPPSHNPSTGPPLNRNHPNDHSAATTTPTTTSFRQNSSQQSHLSQPSANPAPQLQPSIPATLHDFLQIDPRQARPREPNSDDFVEALATGDFSSPSLPPYSPQSPPQHRTGYDQIFNQSAPQQRPALSSRFPPAHRVPDPEAGLLKLEDPGDGDHDEDDKITVDSLLSEMPTTRKRTRAAASPNDLDVGPSAPKRPRAAAARRAATPGRSRNTPRPASSRNYAPVQTAVTIESDDEDSLFGGDGDSGGVELLDLTKSEDVVPRHLFQPPKDTSTKLSTFECVICMDAATNLTVTCCGMSLQSLPGMQACTYFLLLNHHHRPPVLRSMPSPGNAYRTYEKGLPDVPSAPGQANPEVKAPGKGLLPPRAEAKTLQEKRKTTSSALTHWSP
ncbi:hypothetical protein diail_7123 [Diaporthe ilicicola]|nr:hypothetical protein diail_7123 [Diaporthe ilicicola]